jgi:CheY-like chemotaxis protein
MIEDRIPRDTHVLVVDEDAGSRTNLEDLLSNLGIPSVSVNVESAVAAFDAAAVRGQPFTVVIAGASAVTVGTLVSRIQDLAGAAAPGFIAVAPETGAAEDLRIPGVRGVLRIPASAPELMEVIASATGLQSLERLSAFSGRSYSPLAHVEPVAANLVRRVLLASGSQANRRLFSRWLELRGHSVALAATGADMVEILARERFDIALLDAEKPELDVVETVAAIRCIEKCLVPVAAVNAHPSDRDRYLASGLNACVERPVEIEALVDLVENPPIIKLSETEISVDFSLFDGDREFLAEVVNLFLETCPRLLSDIEAALSRRDSDAFSRAAHALKGAIANFGAKGVVEQARRLEIMGKQGDLSTGAGELRDLRALLGRFELQLRAALVKVMDEQVLP